MDQRTQGALLMAVGAITMRLGLTDAALAYVKAGMQPALLASGVVLSLLGLQSLVRAFRSERRPDDPHHPVEAEGAHPAAPEIPIGDGGHGHDHSGGPRVAWLLVAPLLALLLIAPPPLGAYAAGRQSLRPPEAAQTTYPPLPDPVDGTVELGVSEFVFRALYDPDASLEGEDVRLTGFVTPNEDLPAGSYHLSRFILSCCAADATALNVEVVGDDLPRESDTWLEVTGRWEPRAGTTPGDPGTEPPILVVESIAEIPAPAQPYEY